MRRPDSVNVCQPSAYCQCLLPVPITSANQCQSRCLRLGVPIKSQVHLAACDAALQSCASLSQLGSILHVLRILHILRMNKSVASRTCVFWLLGAPDRNAPFSCPRSVHDNAPRLFPEKQFVDRAGGLYCIAAAYGLAMMIYN